MQFLKSIYLGVILSLQYKGTSSETMFIHKYTPKYEQGVGVEIASLDPLSLSIPSETTTSKSNHGKIVESFLHQYVLRNRINTDFLKSIYKFYKNFLTEVKTRISFHYHQNPLPVVTLYLVGIKRRHFDWKMHKPK